MTNPSPICLVNSTATTDGVDVTASSTVTISLADTAGVRQWNLSCIYTDEENTAAAINATLAINLTNKTATFTAPSTLGSALIFESKINGGVDLNGVAQSSYTATFKVSVLTANSKRVLAFNETLENNAAYGWTPVINEIIREDAAIVAGAGLTQSGSTINVGQNADNSITVNANDIQLSSSVAGAGLTHSAGVLNVVAADSSITVNANSIQLSSSVAGTGLSYSAGVVSIPSTIAGAGLTYSSGVVNVVANADASIVVNANDIQLKAAYQTLLNSATDAATASALAQRNANGQISLATSLLGSATYGGNIIIDKATAYFSITQTGHTTDVATNDIVVSTQAPYASATGTNRLPGDFIVNIPSATGALASTNSGNVLFNFDGTTAVQIYATPSTGGGVIEFPNDGVISNLISIQSGSTLGVFINSTLDLYGTPINLTSTNNITLAADDAVTVGALGAMSLNGGTAMGINSNGTMDLYSGGNWTIGGASGGTVASDGLLTINGSSGVTINDSGGGGLSLISGGGSIDITASGFTINTGIQFTSNPGSYFSIQPYGSGSNGVTGTTILIQGSNELGTTTLGGDVVLAGGSGTTRNGNVGIGQTSAGGGAGVFCIKNRDTAPTSNPSNGGILYCEGGALKYRGSSGTVSTIAPA